MALVGLILGTWEYRLIPILIVAAIVIPKSSSRPIASQ